MMLQVHSAYLFVFFLPLLLKLEAVQCLTLTSSPSSEGGHINACPGVTITFTCNASQVGTLTWRSQNQQLHIFTPEYVSTEIETGPYTLLLVAANNVNTVTGQADLSSTLEVMVDDIGNATRITCQVFGKDKSIAILKKNQPLPVDITVESVISKIQNFSVVLSWINRVEEDIEEYRVFINDTNQSLTTTSTGFTLEGVYNIPLGIRVRATNCAGAGAEAIKEILIPGCGPPSPPVSGSVSGWTSSQVGAQVTYSCDTDLVLVGDGVAQCSLPSLKWLPGENHIQCIPSGCPDPTEMLQSNVMFTPENSSFTCAAGYHFSSSIVSQCFSGKWTLVPSTMICITGLPVDENVSQSCFECKDKQLTVVITTATVCSFTVGLIFGFALSQCRALCRKMKQIHLTHSQILPPEVLTSKKRCIELKDNEAYSTIMR